METEYNVEILDAQRMSTEHTRMLMRERNVVVAMGANPSASSTPKMPVVEELGATCVAGLHPQAVGDERLLLLPDPATMVRLTPAWDLLDMSVYKAHNWHCFGRDPYGYGVIYTSFGCPFNCYYCNIHALYGGRKVYCRDTDSIKNEVDYLVSRGMKNLKICDELFTLFPHHVNGVCDVLKGYGLNVWAYARVGTVNPSMLSRMKGAGINWLCYGFESADIAVRGGVSTKKQDPIPSIEMTRDAGISIIANFIFGLPGDTMETMQATLDWAEEQNFEYVNFYVALPYPGSQWYNDIEASKDWRSYSQFSPHICASPEVVRFRDEAFVHYFSRPEYLEMIEKKYAVADEIRGMLEWRRTPLNSKSE